MKIKAALAFSTAMISAPIGAETSFELTFAQIKNDSVISANTSTNMGAWQFALDANTRMNGDSHNTLAAFHLGYNWEIWRARAVFGQHFGETESPFFGLGAGRDFGALSTDIRMYYWFKEEGVNTHTIDVSLHYTLSDRQSLNFDWAHHSLIDNTLLFDEYHLTFEHAITPQIDVFAGGQIIHAKKETPYFDNLEYGLIAGLRIGFGAGHHEMRALPAHVIIKDRADYL